MILPFESKALHTRIPIFPRKFFEASVVLPLPTSNANGVVVGLIVPLAAIPEPVELRGSTICASVPKFLNKRVWVDDPL